MRYVSTCLLAALAAGCSGNIRPPARLSDEAAIRNARLAHNVAIAERDADGLTSAWTEDIVVTAGLGFVLRGRTAYLAAFLADSALRYERTPTSIDVSAHWPIALELGDWTGRPRAGGDPVIAGRYSAQWVKVGNEWLLRSELFVALQCQGSACRWPVTRE